MAEVIKYIVLIRARAQIKPEPTNLNGVFAYELQTITHQKMPAKQHLADMRTALTLLGEAD